MTQQQLISDVVQEVIRQIDHGQSIYAATQTPLPASVATNGDGLFQDVEAAVEVAVRSQRQLVEASIPVRDGICKLLKRIPQEKAQEWGRFELDETKVGRLDHKITKLESLDQVLGVEYMTTGAHSGDQGVSLDEAAPWGVIGVITPVTHSIPTLTSNAINMIASGNSMVVNPHPSGAKSAAMAAKVYNREIKKEFGIDPLLCVIDPPTLRTAEQIFQHKSIHLLAVTGGPGVARAAMKQSKRAIVAGPGNPPVGVDETADLDNASRCIIAGAAFDNNLLCIGEKEVFVVSSVFEQMMGAMRRAGAVELNAQQVQALTEAAFNFEKDHYVVNKDYVGKDASVLGQAAGVDVPSGVDILFGETTEDNPFVPEEQMMPFVPFVRCRDFEHGLELAVKYEHGFGHTSIIHSNNLQNITRMGRVMNTTIFVANGGSPAGMGIGGEGHMSYSIATPTGEGITTPMTFTRFRRVTMSNALRMI